MSDEQALGISDFLLKPVLTNLIKNLEQQSVEGVAGSGDVRILINGNVSVTRVAIHPRAVQDPAALEQMVVAATNDAFMKGREVIRAEVRNLLGNIPWIDDLFG